MAWLVLASGLLLACAPLAAFVTSPGRTWEQRTTEDFNSGRVTVPAAFSNRSGFSATQDGWFLSPGTSGELRYRIDKASSAHITVQVWLYMLAPDVKGILYISGDGRSRTLTDPYLVGEFLELAEADAETSVELVVTATNTGSTDLLVLDQLIYGSTSGVPPPAPTAGSYLAFGALMGLISLPLLKVGRWRWLIAPAIALLLSVTVADRFNALAIHSSDPLDPDAVVYRIYADQFAWWPPWVNGIFSANFSEREPFFPLVAHTYFAALGSSDFHLRVVSSTLSVLAVPLTLIAARRRLYWPAALVVAAIVAFNRPLVDESFRGLRTELELCLVLALYVLLDRQPSDRPKLDAALIGLVGAALVLTRTFYLPMVVGAMGISFVARYRPLRRAAAPLAMSALLVMGAAAGHRLAMYERHGDAFYDTERYARWLANIERFQRNSQLPHPELFPSQAEFVERGAYFGPRITYSQYLFELHTVPQFIEGTKAGFADIFANVGGTYVPGIGRILGFVSRDLAGLAKAVTDLADQAIKWLGVLGLVGLVGSAVARRRPKDLLLPVMVATGLSFSAFLYHLQLIERYRNTMQFYPFLAIAGAWLLQETISRARQTATTRLRKRTPASR